MFKVNLIAFGIRCYELYLNNERKQHIDLPNGFILDPVPLVTLVMSEDLRRRLAAVRRSVKAAVRSLEAIFLFKF